MGRVEKMAATRAKMLSPDAAHMEFSKQIVIRCEWIVALHIVVTLVVVALQPESAQATVALMQAVCPVYVAVFVGYFGKSGLENYQKIKSSVYASADSDDAQG